MDAEINELPEGSTAEVAVCTFAVDRRGSRWASPMSDLQAVSVLAALGHQVRLNLWRLLLPHGEAGLAAGIIASRMSILPSSLSFHLRLMTQAGILVQRRSSRHIMYAVNVEVVTGLADMFSALAPACADDSEHVANLG